MDPSASGARTPSLRIAYAGLAILLLALVLRLISLGRESLWLDEAYSWWITSGPWQRAAAAEPTNPPLYYLMLYGWTRLAGSSEAALRALSVIASLGSVALVLFIGRELFSTPVALTAAAYQAVSSFQISYAQEARCFSWLVLWLLVSAYCQLRLWQPATRRPALWAVLGFAAGTASLYTHFIAIFFLAIQGLLSLLWWLRGSLAARRFWLHAAASFAALAAFGPWLMLLLEATAGSGQKRRYLLLKLPQTFFSFLFGDTLIPLDEAAVRDIAGTLRGNLPILAALALAALLLLPPLYRALRRGGPPAWFCAALALLPVLAVFLVSFRVMIFDERYVQASAPFCYLLIAAAFVELWNTGPSWYKAVLSITYGGLLALSLGNYFFADRYGKEQWRDLTRRLEARADPATDLLLFERDYVHYPYDYYQTKQLPYWRIYGSVQAQLLAADPPTVERLRAARRVWFVRAHEENDAVRDALDRLLARRQHVRFPKAHGIDLFEYAPKEELAR